MMHSPDTRAVASRSLSMVFSKSALFVVSLLFSSVAALPAASLNDVHGKLEKRDSVFSPPYYPSPKGGWTPDWQASYAKAQKIVSQMTLVEKVNLTTGTGLYMGPCSGNTGSVPRFGIPNLCLQDSALGVAKTDHNTAFPAGITVGATFDKNLMYARGVAMGAEFRGKGANIQLGPTIGPIGRSPYAGRNWEGFGADPYLQGIGGAQTIRGIQSQGVIATAKHFIANEQEQHRMDIRIQPAISSDIDDRTLHELYIWPFAEAIRAGVGAVMMAYNEVNDSACSQNAYLMNGILKNELGFQGFTMSDWLAHLSGVPSALAGLDMSMPGDGYIPLTGTSYWAYELTTAVLNSSVPVDRLNDMATRIVAAWYQMGQDKGFPLPNFSTNTGAKTGPLYPGALFSPSGVVNQFVDVQGDHAKIVREIGRDAITMLKNDNNILPLKTTTSIRIYGDDAGSNPNGPNSCADKACVSGVTGMGWGTGTANYPYLVAPVDAIKAKSSNLQSASISDKFPSRQTAGPDDVALVFITADSGENQDTVEGNPGDRNDLKAWHSGDKLVQDAANVYQNVVVIVHTVGPIVMDSWISLPSVKAVLFAHLPGQEAGNSLVDILFGDFSPSGHLPYTIPKSENDVSVFKPVGFNFGQIHSPFTEGLYIDYRYYNKKGITPRYAFGHGLSYTTFSFSASIVQGPTPLSTLPPSPPAKGPVPAYSTAIPPASEAAWPKNFNKIWRYLYPYLDNPQNVKVGKYNYPAGYSTAEKPLPASGGAQGGNPALWDVMYTVDVKVTNTGSVAGKAVAQLYLTFPSGIPYDTPVIQLRDFGKTAVLNPGETATLTLSLTRKDLSVWDIVQQNWVLPGAASGVGGYTVSIGDSSINLPVKCNTATLTC